MIKVVSPKFLSDECAAFRMEGWATVRFPGDIHISLTGGQSLRTTVSEPEVRDSILAGRETVSFACGVDLSDLEPLPEWVDEGVAITFDIESGGERGKIEYQVSAEWIRWRYGADCSLKPKIFPPHHLQVRVAGEAGVSFTSFSEIAVRQMVESLEKVGQNMSAIDSVLDFGCGSGRVARTFKAMYPHLRLSATDIDAEAIEWCTSNIGDVGQFCVNDILPPLPFPDDHFDFLYTISTLTHMPEDFQFAWLAELRRVLKPGGHLVATVHGPAMVEYICRIYPGASDLRNEVHARGFVYVGEARDGWPSYFGAQTDGLPSFYKLSYHSHDYIQERWQEFFDILSVGSMDLNIFQDAIVARKPRGEAMSYEQIRILRERAARSALDDAFRVTALQNVEITKLNQRLALTDRALGEAQSLAFAGRDEVEALTRRLIATESALAEAQRLAYAGRDEIEALTRRLIATESALAEASRLAIERLQQLEEKREADREEP